MGATACCATQVPALLPISDLRQRQNEILEQVREAPVVLTQRGRATGVLVSVEQWNALIAEVEDLRDALDAAEGREDLRSEPTSVRPLADVEADLLAEGLLDG